MPKKEATDSSKHTEKIDARIEVTENRGQIAVGNNILQISNPGSIVITSHDLEISLQPLPTPIRILPRRFPCLLDRKKETEKSVAFLKSALSVEFYGDEGIGKSVLQHHLAHQHQIISLFPDGVIYLAAKRFPVEDILQNLFKAFYQSNVPYKPSSIELHQMLQSKKALILLDDIRLDRNQIEEVMSIMRDCTFLITASDRQLWREGRSLALQGLPLESAITLVEQELGRRITSEEQLVFQSLYTLLNGHPLRILQATAMVRDGKSSLEEISRQLQSPTPAKSLFKNIWASLQKPQRLILTVLAALGGIAILAKRAASLTKLPEAEAVLNDLLKLHLVKFDGCRYYLVGNLAEDLKQETDLHSWMEKALAELSTWAKQFQTKPSQILEEIDILLHLFEWSIEMERWMDVLHLGHIIEGALALDGRWGIWNHVLQWQLTAAQALGDLAAEAWAFHQLGTSALCLENFSMAHVYLTQALKIRQSLDDEIGIRVSRHNLNYLQGHYSSSQGFSLSLISTGIKTLIFKWFPAVATSILLNGLGFRALLLNFQEKINSPGNLISVESIVEPGNIPNLETNVRELETLANQLENLRELQATLSDEVAALREQVDSLQAPTPPISGSSTIVETNDLVSRFEALNQRLESFENSNSDDIDIIKRLLREFEAELAALGARTDNIEGRTVYLEDNTLKDNTENP